MSAQTPNAKNLFDPNVPPAFNPQPAPSEPPTDNLVANTPSFGLTNEQHPFAPFPQVETHDPKGSVLVPNSDNIQSPNAPNPGSAMTISPDNSGGKFTLFIIVLGAIVALILAGVVFLYFSNQSLSQGFPLALPPTALS